MERLGQLCASKMQQVSRYEGHAHSCSHAGDCDSARAHFCLLRNREALLRMKLAKEVALDGLISCYQWFFQHLLNIFSFKAPCLETRGNRKCRRYEIYVSTPVTVDDVVANSLDAELLCCNKLLTGKDLLFFGITYNNQHPKGSKLIISRFFTLFCNSYPPITATHRHIVPTEPTQTRSQVFCNVYHGKDRQIDIYSA